MKVVLTATTTWSQPICLPCSWEGHLHNPESSAHAELREHRESCGNPGQVRPIVADRFSNKIISGYTVVQR